jgi:hypothetical protein
MSTIAKLAIGIALGLLLFVGSCVVIGGLSIGRALTETFADDRRAEAYTDSVAVESVNVSGRGVEGVLVNLSQQPLSSVRVIYDLLDGEGVRSRPASTTVYRVGPGERVRFFIEAYRQEGITDARLVDVRPALPYD